MERRADLPALRDTGCLFITSAVESVDDRILALFDKRHTWHDVVRAVALLRGLGLALNPTFVAFTPWTSLAGYVEFLAAIRDLDLVDSVAPIQYAIRLLVPAGSRLLELPQMRQIVGPFDARALSYPWAHPDPRVDDLAADVLAAVQDGQAQGQDRRAIFATVWRMAHRTLRDGEGMGPAPFPPGSPRLPVPFAPGPSDLLSTLAPGPPRPTAPITHLSEPWYC